ncbi:MAG: polyribonucleotide nucleotidyltransferase, partial [Candidatus Margulisbacteria bacterium]|nr:polyribonucleotide nucleotidyltransferase [Candidatus Margulisiibacteriota bacterium]
MINKVEKDFGEGSVFSFETGRLAKEAGGSVIVRLGDTMVMATTVSSDTPRPGIDFFPLLVDFEEKLYAVGRIPGGFFKREGKPTETAILTARRIDRPIRPLFPKGYRNDVQIVITPLSVDEDNPPDILAINGASAALAVSDIPFDNLIGAARVGRIDGKFIVDPTVSEMAESDMDLVVAGTKDAIMMIECGSKEVSEAEVSKAIKEAHNRIKDVIKLQEELAKQAGKKKKEVKLYKPDETIEKFVKDKAEKKIIAAADISQKDKRMAALDVIKEELAQAIKDGKDEELKKLVDSRPADIKNIINDIEKKNV